jgi:hypothetical protein
LVQYSRRKIKKQDEQTSYFQEVEGPGESPAIPALRNALRFQFESPFESRLTYCSVFDIDVCSARGRKKKNGDIWKEEEK